jgi:hypothetical protein
VPSKTRGRPLTSLFAARLAALRLIARVAIKDGRILISLFGNRRVASAPDADEEEAPAETNGAAPISHAATD